MITKETTIWCDGCSEWHQEQLPATALRKVLRRNGWQHMRGENGAKFDICPTCARRLDAGEATPTGLVRCTRQSPVTRIAGQR